VRVRPPPLCRVCHGAPFRLARNEAVFCGLCLSAHVGPTLLQGLSNSRPSAEALSACWLVPVMGSSGNHSHAAHPLPTVIKPVGQSTPLLLGSRLHLARQAISRLVICAPVSALGRPLVAKRVKKADVNDRYRSMREAHAAQEYTGAIQRREITRQSKDDYKVCRSI